MPGEPHPPSDGRATPDTGASDVGVGKNAFPLLMAAGIASVVALLSWWRPGLPPPPPASGPLETRYLGIAASLIERAGGTSTEDCHYLAKQMLLYYPLNLSTTDRLTAALVVDGWQVTPGDMPRASRPGEPLAEGLAPGRDIFSLYCKTGLPTCELRLRYQL